MIKLLFTILIPFSLIGQTPPAPPPPAAAPPPTQDFGNTQNNINGTQGRSFGGGSLVRPNPLLTSADFVFVQNPTYETGWRYGTGLGYSRINMGKGFGINALITFDLTQQTYSLYYTKNNWYYHFNTGKMGFVLNNGMSVTKIWELGKLYDLLIGVQLGNSIVMNRDEDTTNSYFVNVPYLVFITQKKIYISKKFEWRPEAFITLCSPYYDIGKKYFSTSNTFNVVVGNNISYKISKKFVFNIDWRMNMNTTPKWGLMNNILIGTNLKF